MSNEAEQAQQYLERIASTLEPLAQNQQALAQELAAQREALAAMYQDRQAQPPQPSQQDLSALDQSLLKGLTSSPSRVFAEFAGNLRQSIQQEYDRKLQAEISNFRNEAQRIQFEDDWLKANPDVAQEQPTLLAYLNNHTDPRAPYAQRVEQAGQMTRAWIAHRVEQEKQAQVARARAASMPAPGGYDAGMLGQGAAIERSSQDYTHQTVTDMKAWQGQRRRGLAAKVA